MEFHLSAKHVRPNSRGGAKAVAAYIAGETSVDGLRINNPHRREDIVFQGLALPSGAHFSSAREMWSAADLAERTKTGEYQKRGGDRRPKKDDGKPKRPAGPVLATHANLALPWGTTEAQAHAIAQRLCKHLTEHHRVGVQWACHAKGGRIDHLHLLWTSRTISDSGMGKKARTLNAVATRGTKDEPGINPMTELRALASTAILDATGVKWDHRSFEERGIDLIPEPKMDRQRLREEKRRAKKLGIKGPTAIEQEYAEVRAMKAELNAHQARKKLYMLYIVDDPARRRALTKQRQALKAEQAQAQPQPVMVYPATPAPAPAPATPPRPRLDLAQQLAAMRGAQEPVRPTPTLEQAPAPAPTATVMPGNPPGAAPPPLVPAAQEERTQPPSTGVDKERNPLLTGPDGKPRSRRQQLVFATILDAEAKGDTSLLKAATDLIRTIWKASAKTAQAMRDEVLGWGRTHNRSALPAPLPTPEACKAFGQAVLDHRAAKAAGRTSEKQTPSR